ncbi:MAG: glycosyltransferase family 2 protein [Thermoleophilia bacterium]
MRVDVVVVSFNSRDRLRGCVEQLAGLDWARVIVVDNDSADGSLEAVADLDVVAVQLDVNGGFAHGVNAGAARGDAPYVLLLNPDARLASASLRRLVACLDAEPGVGAVAPNVLEADGSLAYSQRRFPRVVSSLAQVLYLHRVLPHAGWTDELVRDPAAYAAPRSAEWVSGACILVRRSVLQALGGLDEGYFLYAEDVELCRGVHDLGLEVRFEPAAVCAHEGGASAPSWSLVPILIASRLRYLRKHHRAPVALALRVLVALEALTHAALTRHGSGARRAWLRAFGVAALGREPAQSRMARLRTRPAGGPALAAGGVAENGR